MGCGLLPAGTFHAKAHAHAVWPDCRHALMSASVNGPLSILSCTRVTYEVASLAVPPMMLMAFERTALVPVFALGRSLSTVSARPLVRLKTPSVPLVVPLTVTICDAM